MAGSVHMPSISVIIPAYNESACIPETLNHLYAAERRLKADWVREIALNGAQKLLDKDGDASGLSDFGFDDTVLTATVVLKLTAEEITGKKKV